VNLGDHRHDRTRRLPDTSPRPLSNSEDKTLEVEFRPRSQPRELWHKIDAITALFSLSTIAIGKFEFRSKCSPKKHCASRNDSGNSPALIIRA